MPDTHLDITEWKISALSRNFESALRKKQCANGHENRHQRTVKAIRNQDARDIINQVDGCIEQEEVIKYLFLTTSLISFLVPVHSKHLQVWFTEGPEARKVHDHGHHPQYNTD